MKIVLREAEYRYCQGFHLKPVSFEIKSGSFAVLTGPNGSGKSTLFSLINGLVKPVGGTVAVDGREISTIPSKERARIMGMVPQINKITFDYTVEEMVAMGRYPYQALFSGESKTDREAVDHVIDRLELAGYRTRSIQSLSGGEYQRVLLARVLVQQTEILLLDEPGNHLDLKHQTMLLNLLKEEVNRGKTVVAVLHDLNQALYYADCGMLLKDGECVRSGNPGDFLTRSTIKDVFGVSMKEYQSSDGFVIFGLDGSGGEMRRIEY
jgi:iron complex transport system ATP-binding protein